MTDADREMLTELHTMASITRAEVTDIKKAVFGNGQPGIKDRLLLVEEKQATCIETRAKDATTANTKTSLVVAIAAVIVAVVAIVKG